jgi:hypothetical protein
VCGALFNIVLVFTNYRCVVSCSSKKKTQEASFLVLCVVMCMASCVRRNSPFSPNNQRKSKNNRNNCLFACMLHMEMTHQLIVIVFIPRSWCCLWYYMLFELSCVIELEGKKRRRRIFGHSMMYEGVYQPMVGRRNMQSQYQTWSVVGRCSRNTY